MNIKAYTDEFEWQLKEQNAIYHSAAVKFNLSDTAMWILYTVSGSEKEYSQQELCRISYFAKQTVNTAINSLSEKGLVVLKSACGSRKEKKIVLTPQGREYAKNTTDKLHKAEERTYKHFSEKELNLYLEMTKKITEFLREETEKID